jgi:predicted acetyltransferase
LIKQWGEVESIPTSPWILFEWDNFEEFLRIIEKDIYNSPWVNAHFFFLSDGKEIVWAIQIRHHINHPNLIEKWWHIWYWIAPKFRRKWYWTKILELWLIEAKKLWIKRVMIWCNPNNIWSNKIIKSNWGIFERVTKCWEGNRYWVEL